MTLAVRFRPRVNFCANDVQQAQLNAAMQQKEELQNSQKTSSDIGAMTEAIRLDNQIRDAKVPPVKEVAEVAPENNSAKSVAENGTLKSPQNVTDVIKNFHKGKSYSKVEHSNMLMNQMNQYAVSNMILHGLV